MATANATRNIRFTYPEAHEAATVLCVDDDHAILELLEDVLTSCGVRPVCVSDSLVALRLAKTEAFDVVVLDYHMPKMDGLQLADQIRKTKPDINLVLFSGAPLPIEAMATVSRVVHKSEGALRLAETIFKFIPAR
jgi:CheY-like chemotaxis protein